MKVKIALLVFLGLVHISVTLLTVVPGYLSIDEALFHWMTNSFSRTGGLALPNGYQEYPSEELVHPYLRLHAGELFSPIPYLFPILATPFYRVFGFFGLFFLNALGFMAVVGLVFLIARELFRDRDLALNACLILALATFAWEYSQAAWPHATSLVFVTASYFLCVLAYGSRTRGRAALFALAAGFVAACGAGVRIDTLLVIPGLILPFLFARPWRPADAALVVLGAVPGLAMLAITNFIKFGSYNPLSYGQDASRPLLNTPLAPPVEIIVAALGVILLVWILTRSSVEELARKHALALITAVVAVAVVTVVLVPGMSDFVEGFLTNAYTALVDIRSLDPSIVWAPGVRTAGGGVVYIGAHKKALLQSLPFLPLLLVPIARLARGGKDFSALAMLLVVPLTVMAYSSYSFLQGEGGGGLCLNSRYLLPCLPFVAILCAYALKELKMCWGAKGSRLVPAAAMLLTVVAYLLLIEKLFPTPDLLEFPLLRLPLLVGFCLLVLLAAVLAAENRNIRWLRGTASAAVVVALTWACLVAFLYDYPHHRHVRRVHYDFGVKLLEVVPAHSIFFAGYGFFTASVNLIEKGDVYLAFPERDRFRDFPELLKFSLNEGRRSFAILPETLWEQLQAGPLKGLEIKPLVVYGTSVMAEISLPREGRGEARFGSPVNPAHQMSLKSVSLRTAPIFLSSWPNSPTRRFRISSCSLR
ncbi:MAG: hypothetical protein HY914_00895 [Desulfomonile tiedjei]|nr:hypothetical protein [Desulfomonile tiedjei]